MTQNSHELSKPNRTEALKELLRAKFKKTYETHGGDEHSWMELAHGFSKELGPAESGHDLGLFPIYLKAEYPLLAEVAEYEWSIDFVRAINFPSALPNETSSTKSYLTLNPFVRILKFKHNILSGWENLTFKPSKEIVVVTKSLSDEVLVFTPDLIEASMMDALSETPLTPNSLLTLCLSEIKDHDWSHSGLESFVLNMMEDFSKNFEIRLLRLIERRVILSCFWKVP